jgi:NADPH:quinone reductase-like Zn-dependent oxidoreductase
MTITNRAALLPLAGKALNVSDVDVSHPAHGEVLIRNYAVALQPLDAKMLIAGYGPAASLQYPAILGTGGAGVVEELGVGVEGLKVGDRVVFDTKAYVVSEKNRRQGTWQQLVICEAATVAKVRSLGIFEYKEFANFGPDWRHPFRASRVSRLSVADGGCSTPCFPRNGATGEW